MSAIRISTDVVIALACALTAVVAPLASARNCAPPIGTRVIGILLADDHHQPIVVAGKPVTALVTVTPDNEDDEPVSIP